MNEAYDSEYRKMIEGIEKIAHKMKDISDIAVCQYTPIVDQVKLINCYCT